MKKIPIALFFALLSVVTTAQTIRYIKPGGTGNGSSWANASGDLQVMINASAANDVVWVAAGTYKPVYRADNGSAANAYDRDNAFVLKTDVKVYGGFAGAETLLTQRNWATNPTILSGDLTGNDTYDADGKLSANGEENASHVVISAGDAGTARIDGFTIRGGYAKNGGSFITVNGQRVGKISGGGMFNAVSSPGIFNCSFNGNSSSIGGGMYNNSSSPYISNCSFNGNAASEGGGMYNTISSPRISNCSFNKNTASMGGGVYNNDSFAEISNCSFIKNKAHSIGGGIYNNNSSPGIFNCVISENTADYGGGVYFSYGHGIRRIVNCCIRGNSASSLGGGIYTETLDICYVVNCTLTKNTSPRGAGIYSTAGLVNIQNTILWDNSTGVDGYHTFNHSLTGATDPLFTNAAAGDCSLQAGSPAINAGDNTSYEAADGNTGNNSLTTDTDVAGNTRLIETVIDIGAYEVQQPHPDANGIMYVTQSGAGNFTGNSWANAIPDLQVAINTTGAQQVWVAAGIYKPAHRADNGSEANPSDRDNAFVLKTDVKVYGGFAGTETQLTQRNWATNTTILSGDLAGNDTYDATGKLTANGNENAYHVVVAAGNAGTARLDGFVIRSGNANGSDFPITVNGQTTYNGFGGGMEIVSSSPFISNCTFSGNAATYGGGLFNDYASPRIVNCCFKGNSASRFGGGIFNNVAGYGYVVNCTFAGNTANYGGGIYSSAGWLNVQNTIIWGNSSGALGSNFAPFSYCLIQGQAGGSNGNIDGSTDPLFTNIAAGGCSLKAGSPAINTGSNGSYEAADGDAYNSSLTTDNDLAGNARLFDGVIDIGAYERSMKQQTITATSLLIKIYGDADLSPATASSGLPVAYTSSNTAIASVTGDYIHITGVGTTTITASQIGNSEYDPATGASIALTVTPKDLTVTADAKSKVYGDADPVLTYTATGLVGIDALTGSLNRVAGENTGTHAINQGTLSAGNNYTLNYTLADLTITPKALTVTADARLKVYGDADPVLTYTYSPALVSGDGFTGVLNRTPGENTGNYSIVKNTLTVNNNYQLTYVPANLVINKALLTATAGDKTVCLEDAVGTVPVSYTGFKNGDNAAALSSQPAVNIPSYNAAGNYPLTPSGGAAANYSFNYASGQLTVLPVPAGTIMQNPTGAGVVAGYQLAAPSGTAYTWSTGETTNTITVRASGDYSVKVTNPQGCSNNFTVQIRLQTLPIPNTFSPNGDGINDYWLVPELRNYPNVYVTIADRDGQVVFESRSFSRWDGKKGGKDLPAGVYFYRLRKAPGEAVFTGWLNLLK
ncbi:MAG TPA: MBG domain-containing protein [Niastella sp.]